MYREWGNCDSIFSIFGKRSRGCHPRSGRVGKGREFIITLHVCLNWFLLRQNEVPSGVNIEKWVEFDLYYNSWWIRLLWQLDQNNNQKLAFMMNFSSWTSPVHDEFESARQLSDIDQVDAIPSPRHSLLLGTFLGSLLCCQRKHNLLPGSAVLQTHSILSLGSVRENDMRLFIFGWHLDNELRRPKSNVELGSMPLFRIMITAWRWWIMGSRWMEKQVVISLHSSAKGNFRPLQPGIIYDPGFSTGAQWLTPFYPSFIAVALQRAMSHRENICLLWFYFNVFFFYCSGHDLRGCTPAHFGRVNWMICN